MKSGMMTIKKFHPRVSQELGNDTSFYRENWDPIFLFSKKPNHMIRIHDSMLIVGQIVAKPGCSPKQAPLSMEFSRQEYWSGQPFPSPGDLPKLGTEPGSPSL